MDGDIKNYSIEKNTQSDIVQEFSKANGVQIIYSELPPQSFVKMVITSNGSEGIKASIRHSKGVGEEALSSASSTSWLNIAFIVFYFCVIILYLALSLKNLVINIWSRNAISKYSEEKILKRTTTPAFLRKEWVNLREIALVQIIKDIEDDMCHSLYSIESKRDINYYIESKTRSYFMMKKYGLM